MYGQKQIYRILDDLSPSEKKLKDLPRKAEGIYNMSFNEFGQLVKRTGYATYGASIGAAHEISGLHRSYRRNTAVKELYAVWNEGLYLLANASPYGASLIKSGLTTDSDTHFVNFQNHCYFVNGVDGIFKSQVADAVAGTRNSDTVFQRTAGTWGVDSLIGLYVFSYVAAAPTVRTCSIIADNDANTLTITGVLQAGADSVRIVKVRTVGITPPIAPTSPPTLIDGALTAGDYKYKITYVDEDGYESNGGTASAAITAAAHAEDGIRLTIPVSTDKKIASRNIYRTVVGGLGTYYYEGVVANNTATTFDSIIADSVLIAKTELHDDHTAPTSTPHLICIRRSRLTLADANNVTISKISALGQEYFPAELSFPTGNGQKITGLKEQLHTLPVFTDDSLERLTNFDARNYEFKNAFSNEGCIASRSLCNCKNLLVYLAFDGIYYFNGTVGRKLDYKLSKYIMANINPLYTHLTCSTYFEDKYLLTYAKGVSIVPNETVYYDFESKTTGVYNLGFSCYSVWDKGGDTYSLKGGSNTVGQVYSVFTGTTDNTAAIACHDDVEPIDLGMPDIYKKWFGVYVKIKSTTATTLTMNYDLDYGTEVTTVTKTIAENTTAWYFVGFGTTSLRARALGFRPSFNDKFACEIHGYGLVFSTEPPKWRK